MKLMILVGSSFGGFIVVGLVLACMDRSSAESVVEGFEDSGCTAEIMVESEGDHWGDKVDVQNFVNYSVVVSGVNNRGVGLLGRSSGVGSIFQDQKICMEVLCEDEGITGLRFFSEGHDIEEYAEITKWSDVGKGELGRVVWESLDSISIVTPDIMWNLVDSYDSLEDLRDETKTGFSKMERVTWEKAVLIAESIPGNGYEGDE